jgi:hypothetical protein
VFDKQRVSLQDCKQPATAERQREREREREERNKKDRE